jgi:hypothetical protein
MSKDIFLKSPFLQMWKLSEYLCEHSLYTNIVTSSIILNVNFPGEIDTQQDEVPCQDFDLYKVIEVDLNLSPLTPNSIFPTRQKITD